MKIKPIALYVALETNTDTISRFQNLIGVDVVTPTISLSKEPNEVKLSLDQRRLQYRNKINKNNKLSKVLRKSETVELSNLTDEESEKLLSTM